VQQRRIAVVVGGAFRILAGALTLGALQAFIQYVRQINHPMQQVASMATILQSGLASADRVFEMLDLPELAPPGWSRHAARSCSIM
jgi:ATP-binding cassette, subfamily B, multidrug efflux pump